MYNITTAAFSFEDARTYFKRRGVYSTTKTYFGYSNHLIGTRRTYHCCDLLDVWFNGQISPRNTKYCVHSQQTFVYLIKNSELWNCFFRGQSRQQCWVFFFGLFCFPCIHPSFRIWMWASSIHSVLPLQTSMMSPFRLFYFCNAPACLYLFF